VIEEWSLIEDSRLSWAICNAIFNQKSSIYNSPAPIDILAASTRVSPTKLSISLSTATRTPEIIIAKKFAFMGLALERRLRMLWPLCCLVGDLVSGI